MPSAILPTISADEIDDLLYLARVNDVHDLKAGVEAIAQANSTTPQNITLSTIDPESRNGLLHMACANNCLDVLQYLLPPPSAGDDAGQSVHLNINLQNSSGNTPLHWAAMNGHLEAVKLLVNHGADASVKNVAGYDAVFEAERAGKDEVVEELLRQLRKRSGEEGEAQDDTDLVVDVAEREDDGKISDGNTEQGVDGGEHGGEGKERLKTQLL